MNPLDALSEGEYLAEGSYALSDKPNQNIPLESYFSISRTERLTIFEGFFWHHVGATKRTFLLEVEFTGEKRSNGYFLYRGYGYEELKGVIGLSDGTLIWAGRSSKPAAQLSITTSVTDAYHFSLSGLLAFENQKWLTWTLRVGIHDSRLSKASVVALPRRA